jgi:hypothetical protein
MTEVLLVAAALLAGGERTIPLTEHCRLIEVNHYHDEDAKLVFRQILFYDWNARDSRYEIYAWRIYKHDSQIPLKNHRTGKYEATWRDFKDRDVLRKTTSDLFRETWTQFDPELEDREFLPQGERRQLREVPAHSFKYLNNWPFATKPAEPLGGGG